MRLEGGASGTDSGTDGGTAVVKAGDATTQGEGGDASALGGDAAGTDENGGDAIVAGGAARGTGASSVTLRASEGGGSGSTLFPAADFLKCNGATGNVEAVKKADFQAGADFGAAANFNAQANFNALADFNSTSNFDAQADFNANAVFNASAICLGDPTSPVKPGLRVGPQDAEPSSPDGGDVFYDQASGLFRVYSLPRTSWISIVQNIVSAVGSLGSIVDGGVPTVFGGASAVIPANTLRVGSTIRIRCGGSITISGGGRDLALGITVNPGAPAGEIIEIRNTAAVDSGDDWYIEAIATIETLGVSTIASMRSVGSGGIGSGGGTVANDKMNPDYKRDNSVIDTTAATTIQAYATWLPVADGSTVQMNLFNVDISL